MKVKVGINGFGRIGRQVFKIALNSPKIETVAVNDITQPKTLAHLLKYDSIYKDFRSEVTVGNDSIQVDGKSVKIYAEKEPKNIPWQEEKVEIVVEASGKFTKREDCQAHLRDTVKKVIITAPAKGDPPIKTIVLGVNETSYEPKTDHIISNASCTTNAFAPLVKIIQENFKIRHGTMTTIHSYTNDQRILDQPHSDLRRARAAAMSVIPTSTGAAKAIELIFPELKGRLAAVAMRVPTFDVSLIDFACEVEKKTTKDEVTQLFKKAADGELKKYLRYLDEELVSIDFVGDTHSSIFDATLTQVIDGSLIKVFAWYDNEWGYSIRVVELLEYIADRL